MEELSLIISQPDNGVFLQKIGWNKEQITSTVENIISQYTGLAYTEEQMKEAKKDRAILNAIKTDISNRRIQVKKALMAPYEVFEAEVKEVVAKIDEPIAMIDKQLAAYDEKLKEDKKSELVEYFKENVGELENVLTFDMIFNQKWLNKSVSIKQCKEDILNAITKTATDTKLIDEMASEKYREYAKDYYFRNGLNVTSAMNEVARMKDVDIKKEEEKRLKAEREEAEKLRAAKEEAERLLRAGNGNNNDVNSINNKDEKTPIQEDSAQGTTYPVDSNENKSCNDKYTHGCNDVVNDKIYKSSFTITGTKAQILSVKEFMVSNGIHFGKVDK